MGDGRYYSLNQFFSIVCLTLLIIFVVINFMIYLYKGKNKIILALYSSLGIAILLRFSEAIVVSSTMIHLSSVLANISLGVFVLLYIFLLIRIITVVNKKIWLPLIALFVPSLAVLLFAFDTRIAVYILLTFNLKIASNYFIPYKVTTSIFGDIKELVLDYVFIVDAQDIIIYKNNNISNSSIFNQIDKIDIDQIEAFFSSPSIIRKAYNKSFVKVLDYNMYFQYNKKEITDQGKTAGYIITFTDITDLITMLDNLKLKQDQTKNTNIQLALYKEIVYGIEKEKEINNLLEKIANNQQQSMLQLKMELIQLDKMIDENIDNYFHITIRKTIENAKKNLFNVRKAVTEYINYYEK